MENDRDRQIFDLRQKLRQQTQSGEQPNPEDVEALRALMADGEQADEIELDE